MSDALFNLPETPSPRLRWMRAHGISVLDLGKDYPVGEESPETGHTMSRFIAIRPIEEDRGGPLAQVISERRAFYSGLGRLGYGKTEDDALCDPARASGLRLWNEQSPGPHVAESDQ